MPNATAQVRINTTLGVITVELYGMTPPSRSRIPSLRGLGLLRGNALPPCDPGVHGPGGGLEDGLWEKTAGQRPPIRNESGNGLRNDVGTIAMARTSDPDSATSEFFINVRNERVAEPRPCRDGVGYAVFGRVVEGMDVVTKIERVRTSTQSGYSECPSTRSGSRRRSSLTD